MIVPPTIRLLGDQYRAQSLIGPAKDQLAILREQMGFQSLFTASRTLRNDQGWWIRIDVYGMCSYITIYWPETLEKVEKAKKVRVKCWCTCCFAEGEVLEASPDDEGKYPYGQYGNWGWYTPDDSEDDPYPTICNVNDTAIENFNGVRYLVKVCTSLEVEQPAALANPDIYQVYCCTPTDFAEYAAGDKVILAFRGRWEGDPITLVNRCYSCQACKDACTANRRAPLDEDNPRVDGAFTIFPMIVEGVNDSFNHGLVLPDVGI